MGVQLPPRSPAPRSSSSSKASPMKATAAEAGAARRPLVAEVARRLLAAAVARHTQAAAACQGACHSRVGAACPAACRSRGAGACRAADGSSLAAGACPAGACLAAARHSLHNKQGTQRMAGKQPRQRARCMLWGAPLSPCKKNHNALTRASSHALSPSDPNPLAPSPTWEVSGRRRHAWRRVEAHGRRRRHAGREAVWWRHAHPRWRRQRRACWEA